MKQITRTITNTLIFVSLINCINGKIEVEDISCITVENEKLDADKALKFIQKKYNSTNQYVIREIEYKETTYALDIDLFIKYSTIVSPNKTEIETTVAATDISKSKSKSIKK